jgi:co-chaperonin GroES (HSP10)
MTLQHSRTSIYWSTALLAADERPRLLHDFLLVLRDDDRTSAGGLLVLPDVVTLTDVWVGTVHGIGAGPRTKRGVQLPSNLRLGDRVCFNAAASWTSLVIAGMKYTMVREIDALGRVGHEDVVTCGTRRAGHMHEQWEPPRPSGMEVRG